MRSVNRIPKFILLLLILRAGLVFSRTSNTSVQPPPNYYSFHPPPVGATYVDPVFGSTIKRISDATNTVNDAMGSGHVPFITVEYSTMTPFNQDNSRILLEHFSYFGLYDGTGRFIRDLPFEINTSSEPRWSRMDANTLYYHVGNQLKSLNISTNALKVIHTFSEYSSISGNGESDISLDGDHFVLAGDGRQIFVYEISSNTKGRILDTGGQMFDSLYVTPDNNVTVTWHAGTPHRGIELFDRNMNFLRRVAPVGGHMHVTRDVNGDEVLLWANAADPRPRCPNGVVKIRLADAAQTCVLSLDWNLALHISATDNSGWFFVETYAPSDPVPTSPQWVTYTNELLQIRLDGSEVRRIAHHRSRPFNSYDYTPRVSASRDGSRIVFNSNYGMQFIAGSENSGYANPEYADTYLIQLPAGTAGTALPGRSRPAPSEKHSQVLSGHR